MHSTKSGFALVELAATVAVGAGILAMLALGFSNNRRLARLGSDEANLGRIGAMTYTYAADNADLFWSFSWKGGVTYNSPWPDLNFASTDNQAAANQAVEILRRRAGRTDIQPITGWVPHILYSHLTLLDYGPTVLPDRLFISSEDALRLLWASNPAGFDAGLYTPSPWVAGSNSTKRTPYSGSFMAPTVFYDRSPEGSRLAQSSLHNTYFVYPNMVLGEVKVTSVALPSEKVMLHDQHARHFGSRRPYCTHDQARLPLLFSDGSVSVRSASEANLGWQPNFTVSNQPTSMNYQPAAWEPPAVHPSGSDVVQGRFRWTRGTATQSGIVGRDFGGPEVGP